MHEPESDSRHLNTGCHAGGKQVSPTLIPKHVLLLGFDIIHSLFDASSVVRLRSSFRLLPDMCSRLFLDAHHPGSLPEQLKAVCCLILQPGSEGPSLISYTALLGTQYASELSTPTDLQDTHYSNVTMDLSRFQPEAGSLLL